MLVVVAVLSWPLYATPPALAMRHHPTGIFAPFADCPLGNPAVELCFVVRASGGEFRIGKRATVIDNPIELQIGAFPGGPDGELTVVAAEDGDTLSKTALDAPGGLLGIAGAGPFGANRVTETIELAKPASALKLSVANAYVKEGVALQVPAKVKLNSPFLGEKCSLGSSAAPVILNFRTGPTNPPPPNRPIAGGLSDLTFNEEGTFLRARSVLVDNEFTVPGATGCGTSASIPALIDSDLGIPSGAGHNTAIVNATIEDAFAEAVRASE